MLLQFNKNFYKRYIIFLLQCNIVYDVNNPRKGYMVGTAVVVDHAQLNRDFYTYRNSLSAMQPLPRYAGEPFFV